MSCCSKKARTGIFTSMTCFPGEYNEIAIHFIFFISWIHLFPHFYFGFFIEGALGVAYFLLCLLCTGPLDLRTFTLHFSNEARGMETVVERAEAGVFSMRLCGREEIEDGKALEEARQKTKLMVFPYQHRKAEAWNMSFNVPKLQFFEATKWRRKKLQKPRTRNPRTHNPKVSGQMLKPKQPKILKETVNPNPKPQTSNPEP